VRSYDLSSSGNEFHKTGAATAKARRAKQVRDVATGGTSSRKASLDRSALVGTYGLINAAR